MSHHAEADHYRVLGVARDASTHEIRDAYRRLALKHHPDLNPEPGQPERFVALARAYEVLTDPGRRADYDHASAQPASVPRPPRVARQETRSAVGVEQAVRWGTLELSSSEAAYLARWPLVLTDAHGDTVFVPAGTRDGDQIVTGHVGRRAVLRIRVAGKT